MIIIGGKHKKRKLVAPKSMHVRPTAGKVREALFNICQSYIEGARFLDLFAGTGAMGLEALSRGAAQATFVEKRGVALAAIKQNIANLQEEANTTILPGDVLAVLPLLQGPFDLIYADPPYGKGISRQLLDAIEAYPVLAEKGVLFIEDATFDEPPLKKLILKQKRSFGRATLFEYVYSSHRRNI